jgi:hypothetical protein
MADSSFPSPKILYPTWQPEFLAALVEIEPKQLLERVTAAETAIFNRLQALSQSTDSRSERQAIQDALASLRVIKRDSLGFPDWEKKSRGEQSAQTANLVDQHRQMVRL